MWGEDGSSTVRVSAVVITRNRRRQLARLLESVARQNYEAVEVVVLDNGSDDGTAGMLASDFPGCKVIEAGENLGVAKGRNRAARHASGDVLLFLDDDGYLRDSDAISSVVAKFAARPEMCALNLTLEDEEGTIIRNYIPRWDMRVGEEDAECGGLVGGACAFRASEFRALGGYWEALSPYGNEDRELGYRLLGAGKQIVWTPDVILRHPRASTRPNARSIVYGVRGYPLVALRHLPVRYVLSTTLVWWALLSLRSVTLARPWCFVQGLWLFGRSLPATLRTRTRMSDRAIARCRRLSGKLLF